MDAKYGSMRAGNDYGQFQKSKTKISATVLHMAGGQRSFAFSGALQRSRQAANIKLSVRYSG
jgi:hypothetical protein